MSDPARPLPVDPRIYLAAERTLLAWLRTGIALMGFGLVVAKLRLFFDEIVLARGLATPVSSGASTWGGVLLLVLGIAVILAATLRHHRYLGQLQRFGADTPVPRRFPMVIALILAVAGMILAIRLVIAADSLRGSPAARPRRTLPHSHRRGIASPQPHLP